MEEKDSENISSDYLLEYQGFWCAKSSLKSILSIQKNFKAQSTDTILASMPKSGTTWLKALTLAIANRNVYPIDQNPLLTSNPHALIPFLEFDLYRDQENPNLDSIPSPRYFATHMPFELLPESIHAVSECKIIYICRNPLDMFTSFHIFMQENKLIDKDDAPLQKAFDKFFCGIHLFGPFWDHNLGYWNAHLKNPQKVLFLKYEDLKEDITSHVKKIAEFIGLPFSLEEEKQGVVEQISRLCNIESLSSLEVNKIGFVTNWRIKNSPFFRKGKVGDWTNYLTPEMAERIKHIMESKFEGSGLLFKT